MRLRLLACFGAGLLGLGMACGPGKNKGDGGDGGGSSDLFEDLLDEQDGQYEVLCLCEVEAGYYETLEDCLNDYDNDLPPPIEACIAEVFAGSAAATPALECLIEAQKAYNECLADQGCEAAWGGEGDSGEVPEPAPGGGPDTGGAEGCYEQHAMAMDACPPIPYEVEAEIQVECWGEDPPFQCGDGSTVPADYVCDYWDDCEDGSDELDCPNTTSAEGGEWEGGEFDGGEFDGGEVTTAEVDGGESGEVFSCENGEEIPYEWVCDGEADCSEGEDELDCGVTTGEPPSPETGP